MKSQAYSLVIAIFVCCVNSQSQRNHLVNDVKPFEDPYQRDIQVPKKHVYSYNPPTSCSGFSNFVHCFKLKLLHNVSEILDSDEYWLTNGLVIQKLPPSKYTSKNDLSNSALKMQLNKYLMSGKESNRMILEGTMGIFRSHSLRWNALPGVSLRMFRNPEFGGKMDMSFELGEDNSREDSTLAPRTFFRRKMQFALLSVMYKMGVMTTLLGALVVISLKTLAIGVVLLFLTGFNTIKAIGAKLHKLGFHGHHETYHEHHPPEIIDAGPPAIPHHKEVHVHIHNNGAGHGYISSHGYASGSGSFSSLGSSSSGSSNGPYHGWSGGGASGSGYSPYRRSSVQTNPQGTATLGRENEQVISFK